MRYAKWSLVSVILIALVLSLLVACGSSPSPTPTPSATPKPTAAPPTTTPPKPTQSEIDIIKEAAIKEGSLNWIDSVVDAKSAKTLVEAFKKYYSLPDSFQVKQEMLGSGPVSSRVQEEVKAGKVTTDIFAVGDSAVFYSLKAAGALLQYDSPEYKNYTKARAAGLTYEPGYWQSAYTYAFVPITNPKTYPKQITSWLDLLAPDLKNKLIEWGTPASSQSALYNYIGLKSVLPANFFPDLAKQTPTSGASGTEQIAKLTRGENLVTVTTAFRTVLSAAQTGVTLAAAYPKEGVVLLGHPYGILAQAPHPNAAKLFINWLYSEEGMKLCVSTVSIMAIRDGITTPDNIKMYSPAISDVKSIPMDWKSYTPEVLTKFRNESVEIFGK